MKNNKPFHGWYVTAACFFMGFTGIGARYCFGVFLKPLQSDFAMSRSSASGLFSIYMLLCCLLAALGGWALDRFGPRILSLWMAVLTGLAFIISSRIASPWQLLISYSLLLSFGTATIYTVSNTTASRWFVQKRGFVIGITSSGGPVGMMVLAPVAAFLISHYSWRTAFLSMGIILWLVMTLSALWMTKDPHSMGLLPDGDNCSSDPGQNNSPSRSSAAVQTDYTLGQAFRMKAFWLLWLIWLTLSLAVHMIMVHVVPFALDMGIDALDAAFIISLIGLSNIPGRLMVGRVSDKIGRNALGAVCALGQCLSLIWLMQAQGLWMFYIFALAFGFLWGGSSTIMTVLIGDIFGVCNLGAIMGMMSAAWAAGAALGPGIAGIVFDISGHYLVAFIVAAVTLFATVFFMYFARIPSKAL